MKNYGIRWHMKNRIIAVDLDGTLCENKYPDMGAPNIPLIQCLKKCQSNGDKLILWTCRKYEPLQKAITWCKEQGLIFDEINNNLPEILKEWEEDTRKIFADIYIDDRAMHPTDFILKEFPQNCNKICKKLF